MPTTVSGRPRLGTGRKTSCWNSCAVNGGTAQLFQQLVFRPVPSLGRPETVVGNVYLGGSSAHPGGGVHGICGGLAARAALRGQGLRGRVRRRALSAALDLLYRG